jgi:hypothetical protein
MKKLFTIITLAFIVTASFAQVNLIPVYAYAKVCEMDEIKDNLETTSYVKENVLVETFDTWPPVGWAFTDGAESTGLQHWHQDGTPNPYAAVQYDDGDGIAKNQDEWMISPNVTVPTNAFLKFNFHSNPYWMVDPNDNADVFVKISTDGVNWTEIWNENDFTFEYSVWTEVYLDLSAYEGQNVQVAFQYVGFDACWFYIDDVLLYAIPEYDIEITDARINFFEILDYHADGSDFHYSSHYQKIPKEILQDNDLANLAFNAMVINKGYGSGIVQCNVKVTDPLGAEIYNQTSTNDLAIGEMGIDTIDVGYDDASILLLNTPIIGVYQVEYTVFVEGQAFDPHYIPGENKEVLTKIVTFEVTDKEYGRDNENIDDFVGPKSWVDGGTDGDILTVKYMLFENTTISSVQAYIHADTDPGTSMICNVYQYDATSSSYVVIASSPLTTLEAADIDGWKTFTFTDPAMIIIPTDLNASSILVGFEFYFNGATNDLYLGCDKTVPSSSWGTIWYFLTGANANTWYAINNFVGVPMIRMMLQGDAGIEQNSAFDAKIQVYPNPATNLVKLSGVNNCTIELYDNIGKIIKHFEYAEEEVDIDCSEYVPGTYFFRIINNETNATAVRNFNVVR